MFGCHWTSSGAFVHERGVVEWSSLRFRFVCMIHSPVLVDLCTISNSSNVPSCHSPYFTQQITSRFARRRLESRFILFFLLRHFVVGNAQGEMAQFDIKRLSAPSIVHKYNGVIGSIRAIDAHPTLPLIASASIDQYVRIHDAETFRQVAKVSSLVLSLVLISSFFVRSSI